MTVSDCLQTPFFKERPSNFEMFLAQLSRFTSQDILSFALFFVS